MKRIIFCILCLVPAAISLAQPPARRAAQQKAQAQANTPTADKFRDFPTAQPMPDDAVWRRDIYRTLDLTKDENATLYYPTVPQADRMNLFTYLFKLLLRKEIKAYDYKLDGNENFSEKNLVTAIDLMKRYEILFEERDGRVRVNDADLPSEEVKKFYIKESSYYDQHTASYHTQVIALCPVMTRSQEDFGGEMTSYPMFWVRYADVAPYLSKLMLMGSNLNNAAQVSADDYFTMNLYKGDIYKITNLQDKVLQNYCKTDTALKKERSRIEKELTDFQKHIWGQDSVPRAPKDTLAAAEPVKKSSARTRRTSLSTRRSKNNSAASEPAAQQKRTRTSSKSSATFSVRRQRH